MPLVDSQHACLLGCSAADLAFCKCCERPEFPSLQLSTAAPSNCTATLLNGYTLAWQLNKTHIRWRVNITSCSDTCWFGLGLDPIDGGMRNADMVIGQVHERDFGYSVSVGDYYSKQYEQPRTDTSIGGGNDVLLETFEKLNHLTVIFSRPLVTGDDSDKAIPTITDSSSDIVATWSNGPFQGMPASRGKSEIHWQDNLTQSTLDWKKFYLYWHGSVLAFIWGFLVIIGAGAARYFKHWRHWFWVHQNCQMTAALLTLPLGWVGFFSKGYQIPGTHWNTTHGTMGTCIALLSSVQGTLGALVAYTHLHDCPIPTPQCRVEWKKWGQLPPMRPRREHFVRYVHRINGRCVVLLAIVQVFFGADLMQGFQPRPFPRFVLQYAYPVYLAGLLLVFVALEFRQRYYGAALSGGVVYRVTFGQLLKYVDGQVQIVPEVMVPPFQRVGLSKRIRGRVPSHSEDRTFTREEVARCDGRQGQGQGQRQHTGKLWLVYRDSVYDVTGYGDVHPGGLKLLQQAAGGGVDKFWDTFAHHYRSAKVQQHLEQLYIGRVADWDGAPTSGAAAVDGEARITPLQLSEHDGREHGAWASYRNGVYDITNFAASHPGGRGMVMEAAGGALEALWEYSPFHLRSRRVADILAQLRIGRLSEPLSETQSEEKTATTIELAASTSRIVV